jgi:histidine ammonia-lyase
MAVAEFRFYEELNDFLAPARRRRSFEYDCAPHATVKHAVEALGVPHTEIELILVNGESVDFSYRVATGDRISVYPMFEALDVTPLLRVRARPLRTPRFIADAHLGALAKYLRAAGFDALYRNDYHDREVAAIAAAEHRIVLSRDRALLMRKEITHGCFALRETGLEPLRLGAKEGLALLNGTQLMSGLGALLAGDAERLGRTASVAAAMSVEALLGTDVAFSEALQAVRPHPGQVAVAAELRWLLRDSVLQRSHHPLPHKVQDPYSLRCAPQVHGAVRDALGHLERVLAIEMNAATDNPLIFPNGGVADADARATGHGHVISGGNFHGEPVALALDFAKLALAELGSISERRTALLLDANLNGGLPAFLASGSGLESGYMLLQYTAAALASENKTLAHPASADSIPTSANQEDHVSMGPIAGRAARQVLHHVEQIVAIELLCAARALDLRLELLPGRTPGAGVAAAHAAIREVVRPWNGDREPGADLEAMTRLVGTGVVAKLAIPS